jgi:hypothetical protein
MDMDETKTTIASKEQNGAEKVPPEAELPVGTRETGQNARDKFLKASWTPVFAGVIGLFLYQYQEFARELLRGGLLPRKTGKSAVLGQALRSRWEWWEEGATAALSRAPDGRIRRRRIYLLNSTDYTGRPL